MDDLRRAVHEAATRDDARQAVRGIYADLQRAIDARQPICTTSGRCCHFEQYGHRLYVTTLELAAFAGAIRLEKKPDVLGSVPTPAGPDVPETDMRGRVSRALPVVGSPQAINQAWSGLGCPFQLGGLCSVHSIRPFGCRIFFCDATSTEWQHEQYELFHGALRRLHEFLNVPYHYVEWRYALEVLELTRRA